MSRRRWTLPMLLALAACTADVGVEFQSSRQIDDDSVPPTPQTAPPTTPPSTGEPQFTLPPAPTGPRPTPPSTGPGAPTTAAASTAPSSDPSEPTEPSTTPTSTSPAPPNGTTPSRPDPPTSPNPSSPAADLPLPPECVAIPDGAPVLLVTTATGDLYQVSSDGMQQIATSDGLPGTLDAAWRAPDGTLWVSLDGATVGRLDDGEFAESGVGSLQHAGEIDGESVALWIEFGALGRRGRIVLERSDGSQASLGRASIDGFDAATGGIGGDRVAIGFEQTNVAEDFRYYSASGDELDDWFDPTDRRHGKADVARIGPTPSPEGTRLAWVEGARSSATDGGVAPKVVVAGLPKGGNRTRARLGDRGESVATFDFDGRWFTASLVDEGATVDRIVLVDTESARPHPIVPCVPIGTVSIDRSGDDRSDDESSPDTTDPSEGRPGTGEPGSGGIDP